MEENIQKLNDISFIGGGNQSLFFSLVDSANTSINLTGSTIKWVLTHMGQKSSPILVKDNSTLGGINVISQGVFEVTLTGRDTLPIETNKYEHEIIVQMSDGKILRPCYGYIFIKKGSEY